MKIALLQMLVLEKNKAANVDRGLRMLEEAAANHDLIVMPEIWTTGYSLGRLQQEAETPDSYVIREIRRIAAQYRCNIIAGSVPMLHDGKIYNTAVTVNRDGDIVSLYDKVHLFGLFNEEDFFAPGNNFQSFLLDGIRCASTICYDLRFPELYRHLTLQGAKIIVCPAEWPESRGDIWRLLAQARAVENNIFILAVNCSGYFKGAPFYGHSMIIAPSGEILAEAGMEEEVISCTIDLADVDRTRQRINALADIRRELIQ